MPGALRKGDDKNVQKRHQLSLSSCSCRDSIVLYGFYGVMFISYIHYYIVSCNTFWLEHIDLWFVCRNLAIDIGGLVGWKDVVVWWAGKMWWFDFARWLNSTAQLHNDRVMPREKLKHGLVLYGCVAGSSLLTAGMSAADVLLMLIFIYILYGGIAALIILRHYLTYRQTYHKRTISFLEYCNLPNN